MLTLLLGTDWTANRSAVLNRISQDVTDQKAGSILIVPELISHETERRLCMAAGDTSSRYAEVLTFSRLAKRVSDAAGYGAPECLDNGGRLVAMASATRQLHSKLKAYAAVETRPEFLIGLIDAVDEFKRCCISPEDLYNAAKKTEGSFAQKLEELSLVLEAYNSICARGKKDPRDLMTWLLEELEDSDFAQKHTFYVDGFPDFTRQHSAILHHLICRSDRVVVSLTCDDFGSGNVAFEKASQTAVDLYRMAKQAGIDVEVIHIPCFDGPVSNILPNLFHGKIEQRSTVLSVCQTESAIRECLIAAEKIHELVQSGSRYRDISVVCSDLTEYGKTLDMICARYHIPIYQSGTDSILDKTVITTVLSAIDAVTGGFEQGDVVRYLKSALSPLDITMADRLENYAFMWGVTGRRWESTWENHPGGLGKEWTDRSKRSIDELNQARIYALSPLWNLEKNMRSASNLGDMVSALYEFLEEVQLCDRLQKLAAKMEQVGDLRNSQVLGQLWEILLSALEQLSDMLGDTYWDKETFTKLLKLLLSQYDVGTIPAVLDAVTIGSVSAMRCQMPKHLIILGAHEGSFPSYGGISGVLSDQERRALRDLGVPLTGGAMEGLQTEFAEIYDVFCGAKNSVTVLCSGGQPSFLYRRLSDMAGCNLPAEPLGVAPDPIEIGAYLARSERKIDADRLNIAEYYENLLQFSRHDLGQISHHIVEKLYGISPMLSASQVDKLADCRLAYFLKYGLRLEERKTATIDPAEFGTYVHAVLEETGRKVMELGGFHTVSLEDTLLIADEYSQKYMSEHFSQIDSQRMQYLFRRNTQELKMVVEELWQELQNTEFYPVDFEYGFDSIPIDGTSMSAVLRGFVDRVDAWKTNDQCYYRVVDYKTGKKDFDYCDIYNGLGLQMLLYLFALEDRGETLLGEHPIPAGVQYFPARAPVVPSEGRPDEGSIASAREKLWKRKGLLLSDEDVLRAMDSTGTMSRMPCSQKKDGTISGDLADREQMKLLKAYVYTLLGKMVDDIASGNVSPNPYTRGTRHNACAFCPYGIVCREKSAEGRRNYAAMSDQRFWEEIRKEMSGHGR
ncbi:MAG: PD-(D/E)XK nuclease family protein [Oscillospiraceae bacterium]|nr:PD-(D/E)XK nuclease family protein [Oscillospiraceae bacterium]